MCKLTFSFIQIITSNIMFEIRIHQLNEKVNSTSGFDMFFILCSQFSQAFRMNGKFCRVSLCKI